MAAAPRGLSCAGLVLLAQLAPAFSKTVFVSSSDGSDARGAGAESSPMASVEKAVASLAPGDAMLLKRGDFWTVTAPSGLQLNGSKTAPASGIFIGAYGPPHERPLLTGSAGSAATAGSRLLTATDMQGLRIEGIAFALVENALNLVYTAPGGQYANVSVVDCHFRDVVWANFSHRAAGSEGDIKEIYGGGNAIRLVNANRESCQPPAAPCVPPTLSNLSIANNLFERTDMAFTSRLARVGLPEGARMGVSTVGATLQGNLFTRCSFNVVMIDAATGFSLQHNVFLRNKPAETEHGSTAVPLGRPRLFGYGTTDLILGYADATTIVSHNDFVLRGEYEGGPDGCAIDLETDCHNLVIGPDNNFWKNVGASVNVFGHAFDGIPETSKNFTLAGNTIIQNGCEQGKPPYFAGEPPNGTYASSDVGAVSFDLPGGTGQVENNLIVKCEDPSVPLWGGDPTHQAGFALGSNDFVPAAEESSRICALPALLWDTRVKQWPNLLASCATAGATLRYTLDGSRPTASSPPCEWAGTLTLEILTLSVHPPSLIMFRVCLLDHTGPISPQVAASPIARQTTGILVRAFKGGLAPSATEGYVRYV
jgi:hypothetical protein